MIHLRHRCAQLDPDGLSGAVIRRSPQLLSSDNRRRNLEDELFPRQNDATSNGTGNDSPGCRPLLLIEPDDEIRGLIRFGLEKQGYHVVEAGSGRRAVELAGQIKPCAILLDLNLADFDGLEVLKQMRQRTPAPILVLSERIDDDEIIKAFDSGANDYVQRPFSMGVMLARLRATLRLLPTPEPNIFCSGSLRVDFTHRTVHVADRAVNLSTTEFSLLQLFVRHAGEVLTHAQILREIWGSEGSEKINDLRVYLLFLRKKLRNPPEPDLFRTERGIGYRLVIRRD